MRVADAAIFKLSVAGMNAAMGAMRRQIVDLARIEGTPHRDVIFQTARRSRLVLAIEFRHGCSRVARIRRRTRILDAEELLRLRASVIHGNFGHWIVHGSPPFFGVELGKKFARKALGELTVIGHAQPFVSVATTCPQAAQDRPRKPPGPRLAELLVRLVEPDR